MRNSINVEDFRRIARSRLPRIIFDYLEGGAEDEHGLRHNRSVFAHWRFVPRRLTDVSRRDLSVDLFGRHYPLPFLIGPTGLNGLLRPQGDLLLAKAAAQAGIPFVLSTAANTSIEEVARACGGELWFQLYVLHRDIAAALTQRAKAAGYTTLILTVDVAVNGYREREMRNGFGLPLRVTARTLCDGLLHPRWSIDFLRSGVPRFANLANSATGPEAQLALMRREMDAGFDWEDLARLRELWPHRLLVKGILRPEDARRCVALGIDGVILSNHGGRQIDSCVSPMETLAQTAADLAAPVLIDSGFRRGAEIVKALALGARMVLLGRAALYGLAARGQAGVSDVIAILRTEIERTLALIGSPSLGLLSSDYLVESDQAKPELSTSR